MRRHWRRRFPSVVNIFAFWTSSMQELATTSASRHGGHYSFKTIWSVWSPTFISQTSDTHTNPGSCSPHKCSCWTNDSARSGFLPLFSLTASRSAGDIAITYSSFSCINQFYIRLTCDYFDEFVLSHSGFAGLCAGLQYKACGSTRRRSRSELFRDKDLKKRKRWNIFQDRERLEMATKSEAGIDQAIAFFTQQLGI